LLREGSPSIQRKIARGNFCSARGEAVPIEPGFGKLCIVRRIAEGRVEILSLPGCDRAGDALVDMDPKSLGIEE
jgi:hypothetical protein